VLSHAIQLWEQLLPPLLPLPPLPVLLVVLLLAGRIVRTWLQPGCIVAVNNCGGIAGWALVLQAAGRPGQTSMNKARSSRAASR
jgi:hypothetical protein